MKKIKNVKSKINEDLINSAVKYLFEIDKLKDVQMRIIKDILNADDVMAVLPTGYGKTLCYITPACLLKERVLVISPLLQLMNHHKQFINNRLGNDKAVVLSDLNRNEISEKIEKSMFIFTSPEKMQLIEETLLEYKFRMIVIDEAHCLSLWSDDFRPAYSKISKTIKKLISKKPIGEYSIVSLTATANGDVRKDLINRLPFRENLKLYNKSVYRENISLHIKNTNTLTDKFSHLLYYLSRLEFPGVIYCPTKATVDIVYELLKSVNYTVQKYHSGLVSIKDEVLDNFINNDNLVTVSTNALGLGLDKNNIRFVIHFSIPLCVESYIQEIGRCGRDGLSSSAILMFNENDKYLAEKLILKNKPSVRKYHKIYSVLNNTEFQSCSKISFMSNVGIKECRNILENLKDTRIVRKKNGSYRRLKKLSIKNMKESDKAILRKTKKLKTMISYSRTDPNDDKWEKLLEYMGYEFTNKDLLLNSKYANDWIDQDVDLSHYEKTSADFLNNFKPSLPKSKNYKEGYALSYYLNYGNPDEKRTNLGEDLYQVKYQSKSSLDDIWVDLFSEFVTKKFQNDIDFICSAPSFFNHTFMTDFLRSVEKNFHEKSINIEFLNLIERVKNIRPQKNMKTFARRVNNVRGAFFIDEELHNKLKGKKVLLVDDIYDTGQTINECSKALCDMGVSEIVVVTLVKTLS